MDEDELVKTIPDFHATVVRGATKVTGKAIDAASNLELIVRAGIGLDNIDLEAAKTKGIQVANTPAATSISVAEHTFGLMLAEKAFLRDRALRKNIRSHGFWKNRPGSRQTGSCFRDECHRF